MLFSCCASFEQYDQIALAGYDRIILPAVELVEMDESAFSTARSTFEGGPIPCRSLNNFCPENVKLCGPGFDLSAVCRYSQALMRRCGQVGVESISLGAPKSRSIPAEYPREKALHELQESLAAICAEAAPYGVNILLEAVCAAECNFINYTDEAYDIVKSMRLDNLHLVFDTYHASMMKEDDRPLLRALDEIHLIHVAQDEDINRRFPRAGFADEQKHYFDTFLQHGYNGEIGVEAHLTGAEDELTETIRILKMLCTVPA